MNIGDITGRIVIQDSGSLTVGQFASKISGVAKSVQSSMSLATLATETAIRQINAKLATLKTQVKPTEAAKGAVSDLESLIKKRQEEIVALKGGQAAIDALNRKRLDESQALRIAKAQVDAGVGAESDLGKEIAKNTRLLDRYEQELDQVARSQAISAKRAEDQVAAFRRLSDVGSKLTSRVTLPLVGLAAVSFKTSTDLNRSLANVSALLTDLTGEDLNNAVNKVKSNIQTLGPELGKSTGDLAEGFYEVVSSLGFTNDSLGQLEIAARAGAAGLASTKESINFLTATTKTYGDTSEAAFKKVADLGFQAVNIGQTTFPELAASIGGVAPVAQAAGVSLEEMFAIIATATGVTGNTSEVTNQLASAITGLLSPSENLKLMYKELKVDSGEAMIAEYGLVGSLQKVAEFSEAAGIPIIELLGRKEAFIITASLAGAQAKTFATNLDRMGQAAKANGAIVTDAFDKQTKGINAAGFEYEQAKVKLEVLAQRLGDQLAPAIVKVLDKVVLMVETFSGLPEPIQKVIIFVGGLAAATGPVVFITGQLLLSWRQIVLFAPKFIAALKGSELAMVGVRLGLIGIMSVGIYAFLNGLINKWKEATQAVIDYNVEVARVEGNALSFARQVAQGPLSSTVSKQEFENRLKEAEILREAILKANADLEKLKKPAVERSSLKDIATTKLPDSAFFNPSKAKDLKQELSNLWGVYGKLRTALADVTVVGEKVDETLGENNPFEGLNLGGDKAIDVIGNLTAELLRQTQALDLLRQGIPVEHIENLIEAAQDLEKTNLFDPLVIKAAQLKDRIDDIANAFKLADQAKQKFAESGDDLDELIEKRFGSIAGSNDPEMQRLLTTLREAQSLTDSIKTDEQKRLEIVGRATDLYNRGLISAIDYQSILLANADQWNIELDETQVLFQEIFDRLTAYTDNLAFDLVSNWRQAWEENESITDATIDTLRDSFLNVVQDIISEWLSAWFRAMAAWLARWIATQSAAKAASASLGSTGGSAGSFGGLFGMAGQATGGMSASTMMGAGLAAYGLFVIYKGFIEDHERKFARLTISNGAIGSISSHGKKYLDGVQQAAESILANLKAFLSEIDVTMTRLGTVIIESSKSGFNVSIPGSTGKLFQSMEEAIAFAQVMMLKYGEFADNVSLLVRSVIANTKAMTPEQLAGDINFARLLETQNLDEVALAIRNALDIASEQFARAQDLFLSFYGTDLPAFAEAVSSILTKLNSDIWAQYNSLAGIEEDPKIAWARKMEAFNLNKKLVDLQLKLWKVEIDARIAAYNAQKHFIGGGGGGADRKGGRIQGGGGGIFGFAMAMVQAAGIVNYATEVLTDGVDEGLQALLDIQEQINQMIKSLPPDLTEGDYPGKGKGGGRGNNLKELRENILDEIALLLAQTKGPLHEAFFNFDQTIVEFIKRAKEAKLPAADLAKGIDLLTEAFLRSIMTQARERAGLDTEFAKRVRDTRAFFDELEALGRQKTGIPNWLREWLEGQSFAKLGAELSAMIDEFRGISDPMIAINIRAGELRQNLLAYAEAVGWSSDQIENALRNIDLGVEFQRQQGINSLLDRLFGYLKQAGLYQQEGLEHERRKALIDLQLLEAQFRFYGALDAAVKEWLDAAKEFVGSDLFGDRAIGDNEPIPVRVTNTGGGWQDIVEKLRSAINAWREGVDQFAESTRQLLTDENLTNLTQAEQLAYARSQLEMLIGQAKGGDLEALGKLTESRAEFLRELRESEAGGFGFKEGFEWVMGQTAEILSKAQEGEQSMIFKELSKNVEAWAYVMDQLKDDLITTLYETTDDIVQAIYDAIGGVPSLAKGGIVMRGPRLVRVAEFVPEAIVPLDRLARAIPYSTRNGEGRSRSRTPEPPLFNVRDSLARLTAIAQSNERSARTLAQVQSDISAMRRRN